MRLRIGSRTPAGARVGLTAHFVEEVQHRGANPARNLRPSGVPGDCHALTADLEAHKQWHSRLVHDIAIAVDRDVKRRVGAR